MPHPKKRTSITKRNMRRSHHALKSAQPVTCKQCGNDTLAHIACKSCGLFKGKEIASIKGKIDKKLQKKKDKDKKS